MTDTETMLEFMGVNGGRHGDHHRLMAHINNGKERPAGVNIPERMLSGPITISEGREAFRESYVASMKKLKDDLLNAWVTDVTPQADEKKEYAHYEVTYIPI